MEKEWYGAVYHAKVLEAIAEINLKTLMQNSKPDFPNNHLLVRHYEQNMERMRTMGSNKISSQ